MTLDIQFNVQRGRFDLEVNCSLPSSGITAIYGPSGCGKTSLLRLISGLDRHLNASCCFRGTVWQDEGRFVDTHQRAIGYVFQEASLFTHLNVLQNIEYASKRVPINEQKLSQDKVIELLGLERLLTKQSGVLSGGERQRVAIARALASNPQLLIMDEPLSALDSSSKQTILSLIERLHIELDTPIIYVSHALEEVSRLADTLVLMEEGRVLDFGAPEAMLTALDSPLAFADDAEAIIEASVLKHDDAFGLTVLRTVSGDFQVLRKDLDLGEQVRLRIAARDISLTLSPAKDSSILNIFPAVVEGIKPVGDAQMLVRLNANGGVFLARVTRKSAHSLGLEVGCLVHAQAKSIALL